MKKINKKIVILAGLGGRSDDKQYRRFKDILNNYLIFAPRWKYRSLKHYSQDFINFLHKHHLKDGEYNAFGFSLGAYILACSSVKPHRSVYASMSPLFKEDLKKWPKKWIDGLGKRRFHDNGIYVPKPRSVFVIGRNEPSFFYDAAKRYTKKVILVDNVGHDLFDNRYFDLVTKLLTS